jgi:hypothetical protein
MYLSAVLGGAKEKSACLSQMFLGLFCFIESFAMPV